MKYIYITFFIFCFTKLSSQHEPYRAIYDATGFLYNPAMTAAGDYMEWGVIYQQQWLGFNDAPKTSSIYGQYPFAKLNMSIGGGLLHDETGPFTQNAVKLNYSYKIQVGFDGQLSIGLLARLGQLKFNASNIILEQNDDPLFNESWTSKLSPNFGVGIFYTTDNRMFGYSENAFFAGLAFSDILPINYSTQTSQSRFFKNSIQANAMLGARFANNTGFFEPSLWVQYSSPKVIFMSAKLLFESEERYWGGISFTNEMTFSMQAGIYLSEGIFKDGHLRVGAMAGYNLGKLIDHKGAGVELLLAYRFYQ